MESKARILIVDDEEGIRNMLSFALIKNGYKVVTASNGHEGIEKVKNEKFDLAVLDIKMPEMDGVTLLGKIKEVDPEIEVIMATGYGTMETVIESMRKGACDYIGKPYTIEEVYIVIEKALENRKLKETVLLYEISKAIFSTIKFEELLGIIIDSTIKILKANDASLMLLDKGKKLYIAYSRGLSNDIKESTRLAVGERIAGWVVEHRQPLILSGPLKDDPRFKGIEGREGIKSAIVFPLIGTKDIMGVLNINRTKNPESFTSNDLRKVNIFAPLAMLAIENANLYKDLQETQSQLIQSEKMAAIGQLAGGVAHELNNPLSIILGLVQLMLPTIDNTTQLGLDLKDIESAAIRCKKIVSSLLTYSRRENFDFKPTNINKVLEDMLAIARHQVEHSNIKIITDFADDLPSILGDAQKLEQVFINFMVNAKDACQGRPNGGEIKITTRSKMSAHLAKAGEASPEVEGRDDIGGQIIEISIADNGQGIPKENIDKIFIPFFTTKPVGVGSGLGLSICKGIIEKHDGSIEVKSEIGEGTTFIVRLPVKSR